MHSIFECLVNGARHLGVVEAPSDFPRLYHLDEPLASTLAQRGFADIESVVRELMNKPAVDASSFDLVAPLRPEQETMLFISGFGLTHTGKMPAELLRGRKPGGKVPEVELPFWFLKGFAGSARLPGDPVRLGPATRGICEEAELVLVYVVRPNGTPCYVGFTFGNDFTDIVRFRANKAQLAYCKLYDSGVLPQLHLGRPPLKVDGVTTVYRSGKVAWSRQFETGVDRIFFDVEQMLDYMWQHATILVPGSVHYIYVGADKNTTDFGFQIGPDDTVELDFGPWGKLSNRIIANDAPRPPSRSDDTVSDAEMEA